MKPIYFFVLLHYYSHHSLHGLPGGHGHHLNLQQLTPMKFPPDISWSIMKIKHGFDVLQHTHMVPALL